MKKIKKYIFNRYTIVFTFILLLSFIIAIVVTNNNKKGYLLVSNIEALKCTKNKCVIEPLTKFVDQKLDSFTVYNPDYLGEYKATFNTKWNFFDLNGNWINVLDGFVAGSKSLNLKMPEYTTRNLNEQELADLKKILQKENINNYTELEQLVIESNLNNNKNVEKLIIVSNATADSQDEILFSLVIGYINNKYEVLELESVKNEEYYLLPAYRLKGIVNIFNNSDSYILLVKGYYSEINSSSLLLYKTTNRHFKNIIVN